LLVATLQDLTEGWAAGVQLAALSLHGHSDPAGFVATFAGSNRYVLDYLTEEVLARQPEEVVRFLMETSVLDRLCGPLCDAVTGRTGSQARLEALERANLFLVPLDDERRWWRYHHLFASLLRTRLASEQPGRVPELHRRAAAWHEQHGSADEAVQQALAAGEADWAARLVERHVEGLLRRSEGATLHRWLSALPAASVRARARLCLAQTITAVVGGRLEAVEPLLTDAERAFAATGDEPHEPSTGRAMSVLANVPASIAFLRAELARLRGDAARAVSCDQQALAHLGEEDWLLRSMVAWNLAVAEWLRGRLKEAEHALAEVVAERSTTGESYFIVRAGCDLGQVQRAQGRLGAALRTYQLGLEIASEAGQHRGRRARERRPGRVRVYEQTRLAPPTTRHPGRGAVAGTLAFTPAAGHRPGHAGPDPAGAGVTPRARWMRSARPGGSS
jgi:LuxR family maltose regulon positive regulatory protein